MVLKTTYARENDPFTVVVAQSPIVTPMSSPPRFARSLATIAFDRSIPCIDTPRRASGRAIRPVPIPNSSARPLPASSTRTSTTGSITSASNISASESSYLAATRSSK